MTLHSPPPAGAIRTRVLLLLIALIVCAAIGTVILSRFLDRSGRKTTTALAVHLSENPAAAGTPSVKGSP